MDLWILRVPTGPLNNTGFPTVDFFMTTQNTKCPHFCSRAGLGPHSLCNTFLLKWDVRLSSKPSFVMVITQDQNRLVRSHLDSPHIAPANVFPYFLKMAVCPLYILSSTSFPLTRCRPDSPPKSDKTPPQGMATPWFWEAEMTCSEEVRYILLNSHRSTTWYTYLHKWR